MKRLHQCLLIGTFLPLNWYLMMAVHELGHVLGAWWTGGTVERVVLEPLAISRTDVLPNPNPLVVAWAGPIIGSLVPLVAAVIAWLARLPGDYLLRFFAGFCLIANGLYLGIGSFERVADAGDLLLHGAPIWSLWLFGALTAPLGLYLWHGLGPHFGLGDRRGEVDAWAAYFSLAALIVVVTLFAVT